MWVSKPAEFEQVRRRRGRWRLASADGRRRWMLRYASWLVPLVALAVLVQTATLSVLVLWAFGTWLYGAVMSWGMLGIAGMGSDRLDNYPRLKLHHVAVSAAIPAFHRPDVPVVDTRGMGPVLVAPGLGTDDFVVDTTTDAELRDWTHMLAPDLAWLAERGELITKGGRPDELVDALRLLSARVAACALFRYVAVVLEPSPAIHPHTQPDEPRERGHHETAG